MKDLVRYTVENVDRKHLKPHFSLKDGERVAKFSCVLINILFFDLKLSYISELEMLFLQKKNEYVKSIQVHY